MISALCFDVGGVLALFSHRKACEQIAALSRDGTADAVHAWVFSSGRHVLLEEGKLAPEQFIAELSREFAIAADAEVVSRAWADIFTPNEAVCRLIPRLPVELPLLVASNTDPLHWNQFSRQLHSVFRRFHHAVRSYAVGARKPARDFFAQLVATAACPAQECFFLDDLAENVQAAREVGLQGLVYSPGIDLEGELLARGISLKRPLRSEGETPIP